MPRKQWIYYNVKLKDKARELRRNMTFNERLLWHRIRGKQLKGVSFYRQRIIGNYILDFYCSKAKLALEVDGGQHFSDEGKAKDMKRNEYLEKMGIRVLRFTNRDIIDNLDSVIQVIYEKI